MILICGIPSERPLAMVRHELDQLGARVVLFNQRRFAETTTRFEVHGLQLSGDLVIAGSRYALEDFRAIYTRVMDDAALPELKREPKDSRVRQHCRAVHNAIHRWCEIAPARVLNKTRAMASNFSKPYQAQLIRAHGFSIPETLITNDPDLVREFHSRHGTIIYKSISGVRSIVTALDRESLARLGQIRWCPTQFQEYVPGTDIRVHTVGNEAYATEVRSKSVDYRYAHRDGDEPSLRPITLPDDVVAKCLNLSTVLGLELAGIDLRLTADGRYCCFEVNPSPAFSYYESATGQPIARSIARHLMAA